MTHDIGFYLKNLKYDVPASIVVFLVALPLCLGIALASGAPLFSGIIAGIIGGIVVAWASDSHLSVSGPAAGLTVIVFGAIETLGNFQAFLASLMLAGLLQMLLGFFKAGIIGAFFPASVIKGMLAAIGLILIIKQIPHATGYDASFDGDESYMQETAGSSFGELLQALEGISPGATLVSTVGLLILVVWESPFIKRLPWLNVIPGALLTVLWGVLYNQWATIYLPEWAISDKHLVSLPVLASTSDFFNELHFPGLHYLEYLTNPLIYKTAATLAIIASLETLLSIEAVDKLDPEKRITPTNRELKAQGFGNMLSGAIGGLPITAVIVRSSANINAGGRTRMACFFHGVFLLMSALFFATFLNTIPLACLAAVLLQTGYKLAKPKIFKEFYFKGWNQFLPFFITVLAILATDLLIGIVIGMVVGIFFVLRGNFQEVITLTQYGNNYLLRLHKDVSFLNKALLRRHLSAISDNSEVIIDASKSNFIDHDILETLADFLQAASGRQIVVAVQGLNINQIQVSDIGH